MDGWIEWLGCLTCTMSFKIKDSATMTNVSFWLILGSCKFTVNFPAAARCDKVNTFKVKFWTSWKHLFGLSRLSGNSWVGPRVQHSGWRSTSSVFAFIAFFLLQHLLWTFAAVCSLIYIFFPKDLSSVCFKKKIKIYVWSCLVKVKW